MIHHDLLQRYGGLPGVGDANAIESALGRPRSKRAYEPDVDVFTLAAAYGFELATNHGYNDANKRTAFATVAVFLDVNGWDVVAPEPEVVHLVYDVATRVVDEEGLAAWLREHTQARTD